MASREYTQRARAAGVASRRDAVLDATMQLFLERPYDEITLLAVAERSGVSLKTVTRQFGSKEELIAAVSQRNVAREADRRAVPVGDLVAIVDVLVARYQVLGDASVRRIALEDAVPAVREAGDRARRGHLEWLAEAFAPWLPPSPDPRRNVRLAALFTATELYSWWSVLHLGFTVDEARTAMLDTLRSLVHHWQDRSTS